MPQQRVTGSTTGLAGGFDPSIYKKVSGLLTTPATGAVGGDGGGPGSGAGNDSSGTGSGSGGVGGLGVGSGQGLSSNLQNTALSLISLGSIYPGLLPGGIVAKLIGLLGGVTADSQLSGLSDAQKALEAIDKQNATALESGSSRTFDPYAGTKGVLSVSDADGNVRAFDPYAGDSAKDADKSKALADSGLSTAVSNQISNAVTGLTTGELGGITAPVGGVSSLALDNLGDRPQTNPTTSLPTLGYTGTGLGLLSDLIAGSSTSLNPAPVETREAKPNPYAVDYTGDFVGPMPRSMPKSDTYTGDFVIPTPVMPVSYTPTFAQPTPTPERPESDTYTGDFVGPMPKSDTFSGGLLGDFAARQDEADAAVIASDYAARENALFSAASAGVTPLGAAPSVASTTFQGSAYSPVVAAAADKAAADKAAADKAAADLLGLGLGLGLGGYGGGSNAPGANADGYGGGDAGFGGGSVAFAKGGMVNMKPQMNNPPGPDDGYAALDNGEYVIRKKAVQKYGANIFEQINAGKIPAKRLKSLLE